MRADRIFDVFLAAAECGDPAAQMRVSDMYARGFGVKKDEVESMRWLCRASASRASLRMPAQEKRAGPPAGKLEPRA